MKGKSLRFSLAGIIALVSLVGVGFNGNNEGTCEASEKLAFQHLEESMDKYHLYFDVYTDRDSGGNHYTPSGWMGDWEDIMLDTVHTADPHSGVHCMKITYSADYLADNHYVPSGWMGDWDDITFNSSWEENPHSGVTCMKIIYSATGSKGNNWAGIYWQDPENNWGNKEGGLDLTGATRLTFWARGESGGEWIDFKTGGINRQPYHNASFPYQDAFGPISTGFVQLTDTWQKYTIPLDKDYFEVYRDQHLSYYPSGMMGDLGDITFNDQCTENPYNGRTCIRIDYSAEGSQGKDWAGIYWQNPSNNWGDMEGGYDLTGFERLTFRARGKNGGEKGEFKVGGITGARGDSLQPAKSTEVITLTDTWQEYSIDLAGENLNHIIGGFCWVTKTSQNLQGCTIYIDDIRYERLLSSGDLTQVIGGFVWKTNKDSNPNGCIFYLDDIQYEYDNSNLNVYTDAQDNWTGIYWQYPENNWGNEAGYDLTGATKLTFWAKGENGGEKGEFKVGGINCPPYHDPEKPYQDSCGTITTGVINLTDTWQQYEIDLAGQDLSDIIGGFCWLTNNSQNPNGGIFYLDDIAYGKQRLEALRFLPSYEVTSAPDDKYFTNTAFAYDNALAMIALMARGDEGDWDRAKILGDSFIYCQNHDRYFEDHRLRNAYQAGDIADPATGNARLPGWWDDQEQKWLEDNEHVGSSTGNMAWVIIALLRYYEEKGDIEYLEAAEHLGQWIHNNCYDICGAGGYTGGYKGRKPTSENPEGQTELRWKSTEHNIDVYAAFVKLYEATGDTFWQDRALHARNFVEAMWADTGGHFWTGTLDDGITINTGVIPLDVQCWGLMALGEKDKYGAGIMWAENNCLVDPCPKGCGFKGFDFNDDKDGVWFEGTAHMALAYQIMGNTAKANTYLAELERAQTEAPNNNGKGIVAACHDGLTTGFDWLYHARLHTGATAWFIFAKTNYNPYWGAYPDIRINPIFHDFGSVRVGSSPSAQTFAVTNTSNANLVIGSISITGADATELSIQDDNCSGQTLAPLGTCTLKVLFSPLSVGSKSANLSITSNDPDTPTLDVPLSGVACQPDGDVAPLGNRDGTVNVGDALIALRFALGLETPTQEDICHGDVAPLDTSNQPNPDGEITVGDALVILRKALAIISF